MKFGVGILGATGYIGAQYRQEIRAATDDARIVALCARRRDLLEAAGREDGAELVTDDWRTVVEHPAVDVVLVATPDALHYEAVMACAAAGKHVVCEKPVGANLREAREMQSACRDAGLEHFVPFWTRYVPVFRRAREIVRSGRLGEVRAIVSRWHNPRPAAIPFTWRDDPALSSAGSIADVGSHAYDTIRWMLGHEATRVMAHGTVLSPPKPDVGAVNLAEALEWGSTHQRPAGAGIRQGEAFDYGSLAFELQNGAVGTLIVSHASSLRKGLSPELELHGSEASLSVDRTNGRLAILNPNESEAIVETVPETGWGNRFARYVFPALRAAAAGKPTDHPNLEDGCRVQSFTDAAARAAKSGGWHKPN